jgi:hypothetical protein
MAKAFAGHPFHPKLGCREDQKADFKKRINSSDCVKVKTDSE